MIHPLWLAFWLAAFTAVGFCMGWTFKGLMVEGRECAWCDAPTETREAEYCRRHGDEVRARLKAEGLGS